MKRQRASVKDVAVLAGVSVGTVSNVLNRPESVTDKTRTKVEQAMTDLNFHRNASARQLRAGVSRTVGAIVMDLGNPYFTELARGIEDRLAQDDHTLILCSSDEDPAREAHFLRLLAEQGVRGVLVTPMSTTKERLASLRSLGIPSVLMDASSRSHAAVGVDHVSGGRQAIAHLLAQGHRSIAYLAGRADLQQTRHRLKGAIEAIQAAGLEPHEVLRVLNLPNLTAADGEQGMREILASGARPTAVFCMNDIVALGAMREIRAHGLSIPADLAVVGYDDLYFAAELMTPLTSVRQPMRQLGWAAADLLLTDHPHTLFEPELVQRASSDFRR
ncbi:MAG TPA: LacI family DNA-binding transcriptional regulator, partial [Propionicimonas sp.]|nr:LacI family DNA-binding transcriptional regulator [Propionicimonas sp.]HRA06743.1 LacI family DNA-binding transcriptional regulator [Propionicimonas sp.]